MREMGQYGSDKKFSSPLWFGIRGKGKRFEFRLFPFPLNRTVLGDGGEEKYLTNAKCQMTNAK